MSYPVQVFREDEFVVIEAPGLGAVGQARSVAHAEADARALVALWLNVPVASVEVSLDYSRLDPEAADLVTRARAEQALADELTRSAAKTWRAAARKLVQEDGLSLRDAAAVLDVSFSRVQQLVAK